MPNDKNDKYEYEGVEYIRSGNKDENNTFEDFDKKPQRSRNTTPKKASTRNKSQQKLFMGIVVSGTAIICCIVLVLAFRFGLSMFSSNNNADTDTSSDTDIESPNNEAAAEISGTLEGDLTLTGVILKAARSQMDVIDIENDKEYIIFIDDQTVLKDEYGNPIIISEFSEGDIAELSINSNSSKALSVKKSSNPEVWERKSISNAKIDTSGKTMEIGYETFKISDDTVITPLGVSLSSITNNDVLTVAGYKDKVWKIDVLKQHGTLVIENKSKIKDGTIEIGYEVYRSLDDTDKIQVLEGNYSVIVKGENIDPYISDISIKSGQTHTLDLNNVPVKSGILILRVNDQDYRLFVNDVQESNSSEPITLDYGVYNLRVEKDGYVSWTGSVNINQPTVNVTANLTKQVLMGTVNVETIPEGGNVFIDNVLIGVAPAKTKVEYGEHTLTVKKDGYNDMSITIYVDAENRYRITLTQTPIVINEPITTTQQNSDINNNIDTVTDEGILLP